MSEREFAAEIGQLARTLRERAPLVHNITNRVVQNDTADAIAAVGGTQISLYTVEEAEVAAGISAALAVNLGTLDTAWLRCAHQALAVAADQGKPWVLDPVAVGLSAYRREAAEQLLARRPSVLKGNASEILVLAGQAEQGRGADSIHSVDQAMAAARALAAQHGCVVVVSGAQDYITDGHRESVLGNGAPLMGQMIGSGCMLTAVIGCFLAVADDAFSAACAAVAYFGVAGELACARAGGPGTLKPLLIDALYNLNPDALRPRLKLLR